MIFSLRLRTFVAGALVLSTTATFPLTAQAASATDYVVVNRDGTVEVQRLTSTQAENVAADGSVRVVEPQTKLSITDTTTEVVSGLTIPVNAQQGDVIPGRYIVTFSSAAATSVAASSVPGSVITTFSNALNGFVADLSASELAAIRANPNVLAVEPDTIMSVDVDQANATWGLDRIDQRALPRNNTYTYSNTGRGVNAYVIDTGIYAAHSEFVGRVQNGFTAITDGKGTDDCHGHGTHVSGTIAGTTYGVAKDVSLIPVRVLGCTGSGSTSGVIAGIDWAVSHHTAGVPAVANMSLGGGLSSALNSAVDRAVADGITMVVAAGNSNVDACTASPSSAASAITVGASSSTDARASFSNWGTCLDIFAPGVSITSSMIGSPTTTASWSGTSMASPHVAGIAALYLQSNPTAAPANVSGAIINAATPSVVTDAGTGSPNRLAFMGSFTAAPVSTPSSPASLTGSVSNASVRLAWTAPIANGGATITDYVVQYATSNSASTSWTTFADGVSTALAATVSGLTNGVTYSFRVAAVNAIGTGAFTTPITATPVAGAVPSAAQLVYATAGRQQVALSWSAPSSAGSAAITDYVIEYSSTAGSTWARFVDAISATTSATVTGLVGGTTYQFRVSAMNVYGTGVPSNVLSATPSAFSAPSVVRSVSAGSGLLSSIVSWVAPLDAGGGTIASYVIDYSTNNGATFTGTVRVAASSRSVQLTGLAGGVAHVVRVRAVNEYGSSPDAIATVTPIAPTAPSEPRSPYGNVGYNSVSLYWSASLSTGGSAITGYAVEVSADQGASWTRRATLASTARSAGISALVGGSAYKFRILAINAVGTSAPSTILTLTPLAYTVPSAVPSASGFVSGSNAYLSWSAPLGYGGLTLSKYDVWRSVDNGITWNIAATRSAGIRTATITGLVGGVTTMFRVTASNSVGAGAPSPIVSLTAALTGLATPPSAVSATVNNTSITVNWSGARSATPITDYIVEYSTNTGATWTTWNDGVSTATTATLTGMTPDLPVSLRVRAKNSVGTGAPSATVTVTPRVAATAPGVPTNVSAIAGDSNALVRWAAPVNNGGAAVVAYTATASPGGATCSSTATNTGATVTTSCIALGLTNGVEYTFTVTARNAVGTSLASDPSNAVTPAAVVLPSEIAKSWGLDRADQRTLPLDSQITRAGTGAGVNVYVVDTGVLSSHAEFGTRVASGYSAINDGRGTTDCHGHGSHVAGTIAGATYGFATSATIVPVRVLDCSGSGTNAGVIAGINWIINHHVAGVPAVANMSLGGGYDAGINDAVTRAVADGITFVVAAGNESTDACTKSPASTPAAITVGATASDDSRAYYSNAGACVDLFAPGSAITSVGINSNTSATTMSGTSMASPHVAGVATLVLGNSRALSPAQVAQVISADATPGIVSGLGSSTANTFLFQRVSSSAGTNFADFADNETAQQTDVVDESSAQFDNVIDPETGLPVVKPGAPSVVIKKAIRVGAKIRVTVSAPAGAMVKLYRNGKLVAFGKKTTFLVPKGKTLKSKFHAVTNFGGALMVSNSLVYSTSAR